MKIPRISSTDASTLAARGLIKELKDPILDAPSATLNEKHHTELQSLEDIFNIIPKDAKKNQQI